MPVVVGRMEDHTAGGEDFRPLVVNPPLEDAVVVLVLIYPLISLPIVSGNTISIAVIGISAGGNFFRKHRQGAGVVVPYLIIEGNTRLPINYLNGQVFRRQGHQIGEQGTARGVGGGDRLGGKQAEGKPQGGESRDKCCR